MHLDNCPCYVCSLTNHWRAKPGILAPETHERLVRNFERNVALATHGRYVEVWDEIMDTIAASERIDSAIFYGGR